MISSFLPIFLLLNSCHAETVNVGDVIFESFCLEVTSGQSALALADVDDDGHLDLVVANLADNNIIVFIGDGHGAFTRLGSFPAGENPTDVAAADLNGDGSTDLIIANHETSYLTLLLGDGHGRFEPASNSPLIVNIEPHPHAVGAEDLNGDGILDLIVDDRSRAGLLILKGLGEGRFETGGTLVDVGGDPYRGFSIGDLNGDALADFVTPNLDEVAVMIRTDSASIAFQPASPLKIVDPFSVAIADINGDSVPDIISASERGRSPVRVFLGNGQGAFSEADESPFSMTSGGKEIAVGDVSGDGVEDILISSWFSDAMIILGGTAHLDIVRLSGIERPWGLAKGDLNEDGIDDFMIADGVDSEIWIYTSSAR